MDKYLGHGPLVPPSGSAPSLRDLGGSWKMYLLVATCQFNSIQFDTSLFTDIGSLQVDLLSHRGKAAAIWLLGRVSTRLNYTL